MKKRIIIFSGILLPVLLAAALNLTQNQGVLSGTGYARTHTFPVIAQQFTVAITDPGPDGFRQITVTVPVNELSTNIGIRNIHMRTSVFNGKEYPEVTFRARTDVPLEPGTVNLEGTLTINGIDQPHALEVELKRIDGVLHGIGSTLIQPTRFGLPLVGMGPMKLLDKVEMSFDITLS
ncbi:MAG: YceI family protein [Fidelibacterota bacterium]